MKRVLVAVLLFVVAAAAPERAGAAQSADKVIARYTKAQGKKAVRRVTTTVFTGSAAGDGWLGRFTQASAGPDALRREVEAGGAVTAEGYNGKSAWIRDAAGVRTLVDADARQARLLALVENARYQDLSRLKVMARVLGKAAVDGRSASVVELSLQDARARVFFDDASGVPVKRTRTTEGRTEEVYYGDYRRVDGVLEPFSIRMVSGGRETRVTVERVEHNVPVDEARFRVPLAGAGRPLPDLATLLKAVSANEEKVRELTEHYAFVETRTERRDDGDRGAKAGETRVYKVLPVAGRFVRELLSVDGKPLTDSERGKERKRAAEQVEEALNEAAKQKSKAEKAAAEGKAADDELTISTFLRISEISSVRRESLRGREVLAFDFEPRDDFEPKNIAENIASKLAGTIWVDEAALQVVRLEARITKKVKIGGGLLASLSPDSSIVMEQAKLNEEVWLPSFQEFNISAKVLLLKTVKQNSVSRFSDYERYHVESDYTSPAATEEPKP
jgi:hypothetical protein